MQKTKSILECTYFVKGKGAKLRRALVIANTEAEANAILSKIHGKKGCASTVEYTEHSGKFEMPDKDFYESATLVEFDGEAMGDGYKIPMVRLDED